MAEFFKVITPAHAWELLQPYLGRVETELIGVNRALGRVLAQEIRAPLSLPTFPRSTMDGYTVRAADTFGASEGLPAYLEVIGEVPMGKPAGLRVGKGQAALVHTGGMIPDGADAVIMVEYVQRVDARTIEVLRPVAPGENILRVGDDIQRDEPLFSCGHLLRAQDVGALAALGIVQPIVYRRPRVAILSTGDELVPPHREPSPGQIRDINTYTLSALVEKCGAEPVSMGIIPDDLSALREAAQRALAGADGLVISAGSSVSTRDMTAEVIGSLGKPGILVHGIAVRPGKPTIVGAVDGKPVFGLPGNPVSAMVVFDLVVRPAIFKIGGCAHPPEPPRVTARLSHNIASTTGREDWVPVKLEIRSGELWADPIFGESNLISILIRADGLARVPLDRHGLVAGETVEVRVFE